MDSVEALKDIRMQAGGMISYIVGCLESMPEMSPRLQDILATLRSVSEGIYRKAEEGLKP